MSERREDRTYFEGVYRRAAHATSHVHIGKDTVLDVDSVYRDEDRVVLQIGDGPAEICLFLHAPELERLHDLVHEAFAELGHSATSRATHEAYCHGWDDAVSWLQTSTDEPIPANAPGGAA